MLNPSWIVFSGTIAEHGSGISPVEAPTETGARPFLLAVQHALARNATAQAQANLETKTWLDLRSPDQTLSPELLGALALVVDHLGDAYLLRPIERWIREPKSRLAPVSFVQSCGGG